MRNQTEYLNHVPGRAGCRFVPGKGQNLGLAHSPTLRASQESFPVMKASSLPPEPPFFGQGS